MPLSLILHNPLRAISDTHTPSRSPGSPQDPFFLGARAPEGRKFPVTDQHELPPLMEQVSGAGRRGKRERETRRSRRREEGEWRCPVLLQKPGRKLGLQTLHRTHR